MTAADLLTRIETYYDAVPRPVCDVEELGALVLFVSRSPGSFAYARPNPEATRPVQVGDVLEVRARQRALGAPEAVEWIGEVTPSLRTAVEQAGLSVRELPLLTLEPGQHRPAAAPAGVAVRLLAPDAPDLALARSVANLAFAEPGGDVGATGRVELLSAAAQLSESSLAALRARLSAGQMTMAAAYDAEGPLAVGSHQPVGRVTEIAGVGTLPAARRRGLAAVVTSALVENALGRGIEIVFLSAADAGAARLYGRLGFRPVATAMIAEPTNA